MCLFLSIQTTGKAQVILEEMIIYETSFEEPISWIEIDTTQPNNIWQIGHPNKPGFDSVVYGNKVLITDTINPYPPNNKSSFQIRIKTPFPQFCIGKVDIAFTLKYQTDSLHASFYTEVSYDDGRTWKNIINDEMQNMRTFFFYYYDDTYINIDTIPRLTGFMKKWGYANYIWHWYEEGWGSVDSAIYRFTFESDSTQTNKGGVMIDLFRMDVYNYCWESVNRLDENKIKVLPNPVTQISYIDFKGLQFTELHIYDMLGRIQYQTNDLNTQLFEITREKFNQGCYFYVLAGKNNKTVTGKFIVE